MELPAPLSMAGRPPSALPPTAGPPVSPVSLQTNQGCSKQQHFIATGIGVMQPAVLWLLPWVFQPRPLGA